MEIEMRDRHGTTNFIYGWFAVTANVAIWIPVVVSWIFPVRVPISVPYAVPVTAFLLALVLPLLAAWKASKLWLWLLLNPVAFFALFAYEFSRNCC